MTGFLLRFRDNWKQNYAAIVVYGYAYDIIAWPLLFWGTTIGTAATGFQWPGPPLVPYEQLLAATANLAVIGGVEIWRESKRKEPTDGQARDSRQG